jgi:hypothetical protein
MKTQQAVIADKFLALFNALSRPLTACNAFQRLPHKK